MAAVELWSTSLWNDANLVAYYRAEDLIDNKPSGSFHLTNNNSVTFSAGQFNNAAQLGATNTNKYLSVASALGIDGGNITINFWFNSPTNTSVNDHDAFVALFSSGSGGSGVEYGIGIGNTVAGVSAFRLKAAVAYQETAKVAFSINTTYMATLTYNGTTVILYLNGSSVGSAAASGTGTDTSASQFTIGRRADTTSINYVSGWIDDVSVFSRVLTPTEISNLANGTLGPAIHLETAGLPLLIY